MPAVERSPLENDEMVKAFTFNFFEEVPIINLCSSTEDSSADSDAVASSNPNSEPNGDQVESVFPSPPQESFFEPASRETSFEPAPITVSLPTTSDCNLYLSPALSASSDYDLKLDCISNPVELHPPTSPSFGSYLSQIYIVKSENSSDHDQKLDCISNPVEPHHPTSPSFDSYLSQIFIVKSENSSNHDQNCISNPVEPHPSTLPSFDSILSQLNILYSEHCSHSETNTNTFTAEFQSQADINYAQLCKTGQELVQKIVSKTTKLFKRLKTLELNKTDNGKRSPRCNEDLLWDKEYFFRCLNRIKQLFSELKFAFKTVDGYCASLGAVNVETLIPMVDDSITSEDEMTNENAKQQNCEEQEYCQIKEELVLKTRQLKEFIDENRNIIWEINCLLMKS